MANKSTVVACPQCGKEVVWSSDSRYRPFCSERCKLIDLGQWAAESYRIPQDENNPEEDTPHQA
ncbi:MAG: DNA gyrase inhibitor YacG [Betaproteobacteria bacterium]|nr:DNA gyrase inhibitor YacG [Betaproteobacteria bacterium]MDE2310321.1 DNA gyrase inhibitor YacG [Betaproteobacteria bacterium]